MALVNFWLIKFSSTRGTNKGHALAVISMFLSMLWILFWYALESMVASVPRTPIFLVFVTLRPHWTEASITLKTGIENNLLILVSGDKSIRFRPHLNVQSEDIDNKPDENLNEDPNENN